MVKILQKAEKTGLSMMGIEDEGMHMGAAPGLRYGIGQSGTLTAE